MLKKSSIKFQKALLLENCMCKLEALCIWQNCFAVKRASDCSKTSVVGVPSEKKTPSKSDILTYSTSIKLQHMQWGVVQWLRLTYCEAISQH